LAGIIDFGAQSCYRGVENEEHESELYEEVGIVNQAMSERTSQGSNRPSD
jgi:hypothetical protein